MYKILKQDYVNVYSYNMYLQCILRRGSGLSLSLGSIQMILTKTWSQVYVLIEFWCKTAENFGPISLLTKI